jgi:hypothetical protein
MRDMALPDLGDDLAADARLAARRGRSSTPWDVDTIAVPMPPSTFGMCLAST